MAKPISIDFTADTRKVIRETDNLADGFDEVSDSLKDLARDADKSGDKIGDSIKDAAKSGDKLEDALDDSGDAARDMERRISAAFDSVSQDARDAGRNVERSVREGADGASEGVQDLGEEARMEAQSMAGSFDGSTESIAESFQALASVAFAGFGPAGAAAGVAAAMGLGLAMAKLQETAEVNTEAKQAMADLGREIYATGGKLDAADLAGKIADIAFSLASEDSWIKFGDNAETYVGLVKDSLEGLDPSIARDAFQGLAGDLDAASRAQSALAEANREGKAALEDHIVSVDNYGNIIYDKEGAAIRDSIERREELAEKITETSGVQADATAEVDYYTSVMGKSTEATEAQADALEEARAKVQELADAQADAAGANMDAEEAAISYTETLNQLTEDVATNGQTMDMATEAGRANRQSLVDLAESSNAVTESLVNQGGSTADVTARAWELREAFIQTAIAAGMDRTAAEELATAYGLVPGNVDTMVQAHGTEEAKAAVESIPESKDATVNVQEQGTAQAQGTIDAVEGTEAEVKVKETGAAAVQSKIDGIKGRDVSVNLVIGNASAFQAEVDRLTAPRRQYVDQIARPGAGVAP